MYPAIARAFLRWALLRAALARGWWAVTAVYLVIVAGLTPSQLILIGVFQGITVVVAEIPAGVIADAVSRRLSLVASHVVMGAGMAMTGVVASYELLVVSNCLWGLGWALSSGADVAWLTDELDRPDLIDRVLAAQARWGLAGTMLGLVLVGLLAWVTTMPVAMAFGGLGMIALGVAVSRWPETRFVAAGRGRAWIEAKTILHRGAQAARADPVILAMLAGTFIVNGAVVGFGRLLEQRLVGLGLPTSPDPVIWFAAIALVAAALGAISLRAVERRVDRNGVARRLYVVSCVIGGVCLAGFANAPDLVVAVGCSLVISGIGLPIVRVAETIVVNRRTEAEVRATVHSFLSQGENLGEIVLGLGLAVLAGAASATTALTVSAALLASAGALVSRTGE